MNVQELLSENAYEKKLEKLRFEEGMALLEQLVAQVEKGDLPLEDSLRAYERGMALLKCLGKHLSDAQKRVESLSRESAEE